MIQWLDLSRMGQLVLWLWMKTAQRDNGQPGKDIVRPKSYVQSNAEKRAAAFAISNCCACNKAPVFSSRGGVQPSFGNSCAFFF